jgi:transposase
MLSGWPICYATDCFSRASFHLRPSANSGSLTRYRKTLVQARTDEVNRLQKTLEGANLKIATVATSVLGVSGRAMLDALLEGEQDPLVFAELARGKLRAKLPALRQELDGRVKPHHVVLLGQLLAHIDFLDASIADVQQAIEQSQAAFTDAVELLQTIPGVGAIVARLRWLKSAPT